MHLVYGIVWRSIYTIHCSVAYAVFGIKEIGHLHTSLYIVLRQLQHDVRLLCNGSYHEVLHADRLILLVRMLRVIYKLCQFHSIFTE